MYRPSLEVIVLLSVSLTLGLVFGFGWTLGTLGIIILYKLLNRGECLTFRLHQALSFCCGAVGIQMRAPPRSKGVMRLAEMGDMEGLKKELAKGVSINKRDEHNCTFLHYACANGHVELAEYLIKNGIDIDAMNSWGGTALHLTSMGDRLDVARLLIEYGANKGIRNINNKTALDVAVSTPMKILFEIPLFHSGARAYRLQTPV
eukprot:TRINITY_DN2752_c0_g1_i1.p1 TRINITY_DN2752_c0_g1~~TRINITY_DN2752_c0_g1_i1.p1  ORF type:complete len:204 (-),score=14.28 TRINITY_DN2752_c0_g1_i1:19-630(-)